MIACSLTIGASALVGSDDIKFIPYPKEITRLGGSRRMGPDELVLTKEDGQWKIDFMTTSARAMKRMQEKLGGKMPQVPSAPHP